MVRRIALMALMKHQRFVRKARSLNASRMNTIAWAQKFVFLWASYVMGIMTVQMAQMRAHSVENMHTTVQSWGVSITVHVP